MRIHTNTLTIDDVYSATATLPGVYVTVSQHGSRSHARAFEVSLEGNGYRKNTGTHGAGDEIGATWDEWGVFIARLFEVDPEALFGTPKYPTYQNAYHFHMLTDDRFLEGNMPSDTHKRHTWDWTVSGATCKKCSARQIQA